MKFSYCILNISFSSCYGVSVIDIINSRGKSSFRIRMHPCVIIWWSDHEAIVDSIYFLGTYDHSFYLTCKLATTIFKQRKGDISTFSSGWRRVKHSMIIPRYIITYYYINVDEIITFPEYFNCACLLQRYKLLA